MNDTSRRDHWENVYASKGESQVSWFQETPALSLELIGLAGAVPGSASAIISRAACDGLTVGSHPRLCGVIRATSILVAGASVRIRQRVTRCAAEPDLLRSRRSGSDHGGVQDIALRS